MRRRLTIIALAVMAACWYFREPILGAMGSLIVAEDPLRPADAIVVSIANTRAGSFDAARLYAQHLAPLIILPREAAEPLDRETRALGIPFLAPQELGRAVLERSGVPSGAIVVLHTPVDGTGEETRMVARFAQERGLRSVLYLTAASHTARARWLLRRYLAPGTILIVRGIEGVHFSPNAWWRDHEETRELVMEYLRWAGMLWPAGQDEHVLGAVTPQSRLECARGASPRTGQKADPTGVGDAVSAWRHERTEPGVRPPLT